jgi:predicted ATPase
MGPSSPPSLSAAEPPAEAKAEEEEAPSPPFLLLSNAGSSSPSRRRSTSGRGRGGGGRDELLPPPVMPQLLSTTMPQPAAARGGFAGDMASVLEADDDWDRHRRIQGALHRQNFTLHKLHLAGMGLYGRDRERAALRDAFRATTLATAEASPSADPDHDPTNAALAAPGVALVSVVGRAGTGKTRLCESLRADVRACGGFFLRGKFEWQQWQRQQRQPSSGSRSEPLAAIGAALSDLQGQMEAQMGGPALSDAVRSSLRKALGEDGARALAAAVPGLARLFATAGEEGGSEPAPPDAPPRGDDGDDDANPRTTTKTKTTNPAVVAQSKEEAAAETETEELLTTRSARLEYLFQELFRCVCRPGHPVVLFLDDVQWSDDGGVTLALLSAILADPALSGLMVLAACREEEVDDEHPWNVLVRDLREHHASKVALRQVSLSDLDRSAVLGMVRAALSCDDGGGDDGRTARLAEIVRSKTSGNALHVLQFLAGLYDDGLLRYNVGSLKWGWDERAVQARPVTDNVVEMTTAKLQKLRPELRAVLVVAACLCRTFDAASLEFVLGQIGTMDLLGSSFWAAAASYSCSAPAVVDGDDGAANAVGDERPGCEAPPGQVGEATSGSPPTAGAPLSPPLVPSMAPSTRSEGKSPGHLVLADKKEKDEDQYLKAGLLQASLDQLVEDAVIEYNSQLDSYCFAHDMIQEAAFCLIPDKVRGPVQRAVGLALLRSHKVKELGDSLYFRAIELSNVIGSGADGGEDYDDGSQFEMTSDLENATLVQHNNDAGQRAMAKAAFGSSLRYFEAGLQRLGKASSSGGGGGDGRLFLEMSSGAAEAAFCSGNISAMERHIAAALKFDAPIENKVRTTPSLTVCIAVRFLVY